jgi:hypothetical protein
VTSYTDLWPGANEAIGATKAAAGLGAFAWLSFCITLGFFSEFFLPLIFCFLQ